jgi:hypothetical protein
MITDFGPPFGPASLRRVEAGEVSLKAELWIADLTMQEI